MLKVKNGYMLDKVFACVIMIVLLSLFMNGIVSIIQKHFISKQLFIIVKASIRIPKKIPRDKAIKIPKKASITVIKYQIYTLVKLPASLPSLFSGLRVAATYSISGAFLSNSAIPSVKLTTIGKKHIKTTVRTLGANPKPK